MNCVILQPSYIPWRGYFHQVWKADCFIFYDDVQYDSRGWRNRNRIKTPHGLKWLTIPVHHKGCQTEHRLIRDIRISSDTPWPLKHWRTLEQCYSKAPFFHHYAPLFQELYCTPWELLCDFTIEMTIALARELGMSRTQFLRASELEAQGTKTDRLVKLLTRVNATNYISGPSAREYLDEGKLLDAGITVEYMTYSYRQYQQLYPPYDAQVSIIDLLFMKGPDALDYIVDAETPAAIATAGSRETHYEAA
jgi:hypothetical protein